MSQGKKHVPTDEMRAQVSALVGFGVTQQEIALYLGMSRPTLHKHYRKELDVGTIRSNLQVARALFSSAVAGNTTSQIFWLKTRAGWRETSVHELTGKDGEPLQAQPTIDPTKLDTETLRAIRAARVAPEDDAEGEGE